MVDYVLLNLALKSNPRQLNCFAEEIEEVEEIEIKI